MMLPVPCSGGWFGEGWFNGCWYEYPGCGGTPASGSDQIGEVSVTL